MLVVVWAFAWVPLTSHCKLETIPGLEFLRCLSDGQATSNNPDHCGDDGCCKVESAQYQIPRHQEVVPVFVGALLPFVAVTDSEHSLPPEVTLGILTAAPPELPTTWQFISRTALPPRAPCLPS